MLCSVWPISTHIKLDLHQIQHIEAMEYAKRMHVFLNSVFSTPEQMLAQDKGGPRKGGFLNDRLFSYTDLYLCNEINGMCT